jgi:hypothetical protein
LWIVVGQGATQLVRKQNGSSPLRKNPTCQGGIGTLKEIFLTPEASGRWCYSTSDYVSGRMRHDVQNTCA